MKFFSALIISQFILAEIEGRPLNILGPNLSFGRVSLAPKIGSPLAEGGAGASAVVLQTWQGQSKGEMAVLNSWPCLLVERKVGKETGFLHSFHHHLLASLRTAPPQAGAQHLTAVPRENTESAQIRKALSYKSALM